MSTNNIRILSQPIFYQELLTIRGPKITGIYKIENTVNHKVYIGQSKDTIKRLKEHLRYEENPHLKSAFDKYGFNKFSFEVIKETYDMDYWEMYLIHIYHSQDSQYGYNILPGGEGGDSEVTRQQWQNPVIRQKRIEGQKKVVHTPEWNRKVGESQKGKTVSEETKEKIREKRKLQAPMSEESKQKHKQSINDYWDSPEGIRQKQINSEKQKGSHTTKGKHWYNNGTKNVQAFECPLGFVPGRLGNFTQSEEAKQKKKDWYNNLTEEQRKEYKQHLSESHIGKQFTEERKRHISEAKKGKPGREQTEDIKNKISQGMKGKKRFTNGKTEARAYECPEGFVPGTLKGYLKKHQDSNINNNKE